MVKFFEFLEYEIEAPKPYGWFHIMFLILSIGLTVFLCCKYKNPSEKFLNRFILICGIIMISLEIYKQLVYTFQPDKGILHSDYQWYAFPFQFCSVPMYAYLIIPFLKSEKTKKVREALLAFISSFALFAGVAVMLYPNDIFIDTLGVSIQTMVHHGLMAVVGSYLIINKVVVVNWKTILKSSIVFAIIVCIALILDFTIGYNLPNNETFNMFYISPKFGCHLPILTNIFSSVPYIIFLMIYIFGFVFVAYLIDYIYLGIMKLISVICKSIKKNKSVENE